MKLALEATTSLLPKVQAFSDFDWISYSRVVKDKEYYNFFQQSKASRTLNFDTAIADPKSEKDKEIWTALGSPIIVAPSFIGKQIETLQAYDAYCQEYGVENVIGVIQGASYQEVLGCVNYYKGQIAVPYHIGSASTTPTSLMALRRALIVSNIPADRWIHLLGFTSIDELEWYETKPNVLSINTGYPIMLGLKEEDILDTGKDVNKSESTLSAMEKVEATGKLTQTQWTAIVRNIALLRRYIS